MSNKGFQKKAGTGKTKNRIDRNSVMGLKVSQITFSRTAKNGIIELKTEI